VRCLHGAEVPLPTRAKSPRGCDTALSAGSPLQRSPTASDSPAGALRCPYREEFRGLVANVLRENVIEPPTVDLQDIDRFLIVTRDGIRS
jgi:hypothetical protein